jgi:hypothetical protein
MYDEERSKASDTQQSIKKRVSELNSSQNVLLVDRMNGPQFHEIDTEGVSIKCRVSMDMCAIDFFTMHQYTLLRLYSLFGNKNSKLSELSLLSFHHTEKRVYMSH